MLQCQTAVLGHEIFFVYYDFSSVPAPPQPFAWLQEMLVRAAETAAGPPLVGGPKLEAKSGADDSRQHVKLRFHNRFIYVGVDIIIYALLTGERS